MNDNYVDDYVKAGDVVLLADCKVLMIIVMIDRM